MANQHHHYPRIMCAFIGLTTHVYADKGVVVGQTPSPLPFLLFIWFWNMSVQTIAGASFYAGHSKPYSMLEDILRAEAAATALKITPVCQKMSKHI